ncbi:MAG: DUF308 domain-containing protein [Nocardiaceae bacterium]|nr:DUF308 domain-containing protein [Nocardiaceae bacterium]
MKWLAALGGAVLLVLGAALLVEPFASLELLVVLVAGGFFVLALGELFPLRDHHRFAPMLRLVVWVLSAAVVILIPSITARALALVVGIALIVNGVIRLLSSFRGAPISRFEAGAFGITGVILGLLALIWPGITLIVIAEVVALWIAISGWALLLFAFHDESKPWRHPVPPRFARLRQLWLPTLALASTVILAVVSTLLQVQTRHPDSFYDARSISGAAGTLLKAQEWAGSVPAGSHAWRILYVTSRDEGSPALGSALVVVPLNAGPKVPVVAWAHGTTGIARGCAPSLNASFDMYGAPANDAIANGWAVVAPDYIGLGTEGPSPFLIGQGEGRAVLDAVRAAHQIAGIELSQSTVLWGHSQGGHAALWAGILAPTYASEVDVVGVGAMAPAADLPKIIGHLQSEPAGVTTGAYLIASYAANYPDVRLADYVRPVLEVPVRGIAVRCADELGILVSAAVSSMINRQVWVRDPQTGPLGKRTTENIPAKRISVPVLLAQGMSDTVIPPASQMDYLVKQCASGTVIDYRSYPLLGHVSLVAADSPAVSDLISWTKDRFAAVPAPGCGAAIS